jgi:hypothetical protein
MERDIAMTETMILIIVLCALVLANQFMHWKERSDLLDRLMARDLPELATFQIERERAKVKEQGPANADLVRL